MSRSLQQPIFRLIKFHKLEKMAENLINIKAYLILVHHRTTGGGVLFSSRCTFFHRERDKDCFQQSLFREYKHKYAKQKAWTQSKTPNTPKKTPNTPKNTNYAKKTPTTPKNTNYAQKTPNMQKKHQILQNTPNFHLRCFVAKKILFQIYALFGVLFTGLKSMVVYQNGQISGMHQSCQF